MDAFETGVIVDISAINLPSVEVRGELLGGLGAILLVVAPIALLAGAKNRTFWTSVLWGEVAVSAVGGIWAWLLW